MIDKDMEYSPKKRRPTLTPRQKPNNIKDVGYLSTVQEGLAKKSRTFNKVTAFKV